ncbi:MAG: TonB-dependent siderophore receptor [Opitutaceae bacterium]
MNTTFPFNLLPQRAAFLAGFIALSLNAASQSAPAPATPSGDEPLVLSVFEVSSAKDVGYRAATTLAGSRTGEELKNVPQVITVLTSDFIKDTGATDSLSAMDYAVGGDHKPVNSFDINTFVFRGVVNNWQSRNFNVWYIPSDTFSTERIDVVRGPNAILFGEADPGGMMNINTKRALFKNATTVTARTSNWNQLRTTFDTNRIVRRNLAVRLNLVFDESDNWQNWVGHRRQGVHFTTTLRSPSGHSQLRYEGEYGLYIRRVPQILPRDQFSLWNGTALFAFNAATGPTGTSRLSSATGANYWVWDNSVGALRDWRGFGQTGGLTGVQSLAVKDRSIFPEGSHFYGPSLRHNFEFNSHALVAEHRAGQNLTLQLEGNLTIDTNYRQSNTNNDILRDPNAMLPGGASNPHFGDYYLEYQWQIQRAHHYMTGARFSAVYDWKPTSWMRQRFFGNLAGRRERFNTMTQRETIINNTAVQTFNQPGVQVRRRVYLENGDNLASVGTIAPLRDATTGFLTDFRTTQGMNLTDLYVSNLQLNASGEYLGGKFRTLIGGRRDYFRTYVQPAVRDPVTGLNERGSLPYVLGNKGYNTSTTFGGIWQPARRINFFAIAGQSFRARAANITRIDGSGIGPQLGRGKEAGVRLDFADGKLYIQTSVFDIDQSRRSTDFSGTVNTINAIWNNAVANSVRPNYVNGALTQGTNDTDALNSKGHEIEVWINLVPGWTLQGGYSYSDPRSTDIAPALKSYITANLPGWQQFAASDPAVAAALNPSIATLQNFLVTRAPGTRTISSSKGAFNLFTKYALQSGPLKGLGFGVGANYRTGSVLENRLIDGTITPFYGSSTFLVNGLLTYSRRLSDKLRWSVNLNVQNLLDREYFREVSLTSQNFGAPRSWALTNTFDF